MAPILKEMEKRIKWELGVDIDLPSYVDDIHLGIYDWKHRGPRMEETGEDDNAAEELMDRANRVLKEVAEERGLSLEESKEERLILKVGRKKGRGKERKCIKWLGIILDDQLEFDIHWKARIEKARKMLGALNGIGNSQWGISPLSWRSAYTGMIRTIDTCGAEIGWRGQMAWKKEIARLQYASLRKATGAVLGSRMTTVERIAGVEPVKIHLDALQARFAGKGIADPTVVGESLALGMNNQHPGSLEAGIMQKALGAGGGEPSWGGKCPRITIKVIDLECNEKSSREEWKEAIEKATGNRTAIYTDGSKAEGTLGMVAGAWFEREGRGQGTAVGTRATVWDEEIEGIKEAIRHCTTGPILILSDSQATIKAIVKAGKRGRARTAALKEVIEGIARKQQQERETEHTVILAWTKAHIGIRGNERADQMAKEASGYQGANKVTQGGIKAVWQEMRRNERRVEGFGKGRVIGWNRTSVTAYSHIRTGKGRLRGWRKKIGKEDWGYCYCGAGVTETGTHAAFGYIDGEKWGGRWNTWKQMDQKWR